MLHGAHAASALAARFVATLDEQARQAFAAAIAAMPECTMEELAQAVREHPELGSMTLSELLARVRRPAQHDDLEARLTKALGKVTPTPIHITPTARERIATTGLDVVGPVAEVARGARRLGVEITRLFLVAESLGPDDVAIAFEIGPQPKRGEMWDVLERMSPELPENLWLRFL